MTDANANPPLAEAARPPDETWSGSHWLAAIVLAFAAQIGFILTFGEIRPASPRTVRNVPRLQLANAADELPALNNPTLFALPQAQDFAAAGCFKAPEVKTPPFRWSEPPHWLPLAADNLGAVFSQFIQTNVFAGQMLDFKPAPELSAPNLPLTSAATPDSTLQIEGALAQRRLPAAISLTNWPCANIIAPSVVQLLVNEAGNVVSAVVLPPENGMTVADAYPEADRHALEIARALRFAPAAQPAVGRVVFNWQTRPPAAP